MIKEKKKILGKWQEKKVTQNTKRNFVKGPKKHFYILELIFKIT